MSYVKTQWVNGDTITADKLNHIEAGIEANEAENSLVKSHLNATEIVDTSSGAIASFPDGSDGIPVESLTVSMEPIQDLHGQDAPYPAGGGKNLLLFSDTAETASLYGMTASFDNNTETFTVTGTETKGTAFGLLTVTSNFHIPNFASGEEYTLSIVPTSGEVNASVYLQLSYRTTSGTNAALVTSNRASFRFTVPSNFDYVYNIFVGIYDGATDVNYSFKAQIEVGSTATAWSPYSNICPISGRQSVTVTRSGINIRDEEWESGSISVTNGNITDATKIRSTNYIPVIPGQTYYIRSATAPITLVAYDAEKHGVRSAWSGYDTVPRQNQTVTIPSGVYYIRFYTAQTTYNHDISINYPATDHDYHPSTIHTVEISLGQTVYGGSLDVTNGVLTVDSKKLTLDGSQSVQNGVYDGTENIVVRFTLTDHAVTGASSQSAAEFSVCDTFAPTNRTNVGSFATWKNNANLHNTYSINTDGTYAGFAIADLTLTSSALVLEWLTAHPVTLVYKLAEPLTIQLSPQTITSLLGQNNMWSDAGDVSVDYVADTKLYISQLTEPDADMVADANITSGQYFMVGNGLYLATANIANGSAIVPGTNCTRTNLAAALNAINA